MANKYRKAAIKLAEAICDIMNLLYKADESGAFRQELLFEIQDIRFNGKKWILPRREN